MQNIFSKFQHQIISLNFCHRVARSVAGRFVAYHFVDKSSYQNPESSIRIQLGQPGVPRPSCHNLVCTIADSGFF